MSVSYPHAEALSGQVDVESEKPHGGFRADVLLSSSRLPNPLLVEFVVADSASSTPNPLRSAGSP